MNILEYTKQEIFALTPNEAVNSFLGAIGLKIEYDNSEKYLSYYLNKKSSISNYDDFIDYLFLWKQSLYLKELPNINDEHKEQFEQTYKKFCSLFDSYSIKEVIQYINNEYEQICLNQVVAFATFYFIKDKINGVQKEFFIQLAQKQPFVWHRNLKTQIKYLLKNSDIVDILFSQKNFDILIHNMYDLAFENLLALKRHSKLATVFNASIEKVIVCMEEMEKEIKQENVIQYRVTYNDFCEFLEKIKSPKVIEKKEKLKQYDALLQKEIAENGHHFSFEIKGEDIEKHLGLVDPQYEIIQFTHTYDQEQDKIINVFENLMSKKQTALIDIFRGNVRQNSYFSVSTIENLQQTVYVHLSCFNQYIIKEERQQILFSYMKSVVASVCEKLKIDYSDKGLINDIAILETAFYNLFNIIRRQQVQEKQIIVQMLCYSLISYVCTFIEKLLRELYNQSNHEQMCIDPNSLTLGDLLAEQNKIIQQIFGYDQVRCLRYFLYMDENEVGENIRNKFAHFNGITPKDFQTDTVLKVLWLLLGIINSMALNFLTLSQEGEKHN